MTKINIYFSQNCLERSYSSDFLRQMIWHITQQNRTSWPSDVVKVKLSGTMSWRHETTEVIASCILNLGWLFSDQLTEYKHTCLNVLISFCSCYIRTINSVKAKMTKQYSTHTSNMQFHLCNCPKITIKIIKLQNMRYIFPHRNDSTVRHTLWRNTGTPWVT